ncbi:MAG: NADH-quinone oxidoreductase subunit NuoH [candidate division Zixibacteria bacterium]|nr:NADH-quinone oxidoreductase subunit NuoH [candidate division Zixibacteria bacterium]
MLEFAVITAIKSLVVITVLLMACAWSTYLERKLVAFFQTRIGPAVAGPYGLLQPIADMFKLLFKEDIVPGQAHKTIYLLAPLLAFIPAVIPIAVVPFGDTITLFGREIDLVISDFNLGILLVFAITSLGVYGLMMAGWASNSKYSLLGGLRSAAQMISYEIGLGLSVIGVLLLGGTVSLVEIVEQQDSILNWFVIRQPVGFLLYIVCAIAETNRIPFDLPEAEAELVAGYHTEYSSMRFGLFFVGEYANMLTVSAIATTLFFGGWQGPFLPPIVWFCIKVFAFMFFYIWLRASLPRLRYDQLMKFGWYVIIPLALANILVTAAIALL